MKESAEEIFRKHGGQLRMSGAIANGITRYMLYSLRDKGIIEQVTRGIYRLVELPEISNPDLVERFKNGWPLTPLAPISDWYSPIGEKGYTDYSRHQ